MRKILSTLGASALILGSGLATISFLLPSTVSAADETANRSIYQPLTVEDAYPTSQGKIIVETSVRYDKTDDDKNLIQPRPVIKYGALDHFQVSLAAPYTAGNDNTSQSGSVILGSLYQFSEDRGLLPAMAVTASLRPYYGVLRGLESNTGFDATKSLTGRRDGLSIHLNVSLRHLFDGLPNDTVNRIRIVGGASLPVERGLTLLADVVHEDNRTPGETSTFAEFGFRLKVAEATILSSGFGVGLSRHSFEKRAIFGLQYGFRS